MRRLRYLRAGARALGAASGLATPPRSFFGLGAAAMVLTSAIAAAGGCGPTRFSSQVNDKAARAVAAAKAAHADEVAPYEFTAATEYLNKAREEGAYAEYQIAIRYGRRAEELALQACARAEKEGRPSEGGRAEDDRRGEGAFVNPAATPSLTPTPPVPRVEPPAPAKDSP